MTFTELKAKPGDYVYSDKGLVVGRINNDLTEDNRWTAEGKCSIANGFIKAAGISPKDARRFHKAVESNPNGYTLQGYTVVLELKELPVEMWAVKAAEILGGEFEDLRAMLEELSKQPEKERAAKLAVMEKFFKKERNSNTEYKKRLRKTKKEIAELDKRFGDLFKKFSRVRWLEAFDSDSYFKLSTHYEGWFREIACDVVSVKRGDKLEDPDPRFLLFGYSKGLQYDNSDVDIELWTKGFAEFLAKQPRKYINNVESLCRALLIVSGKYANLKYKADRVYWNNGRIPKVGDYDYDSYHKSFYYRDQYFLDQGLRPTNEKRVLEDLAQDWKRFE